MSDRSDPFEWSGGHPALDFVNTLDERPSDSPIENLSTYRDLVRFAELAGLVEASITARLTRLDGRACARIAERARKLREHLYAVLDGGRSGRQASQHDLDAITAAIKAAHAARILIGSKPNALARYDWSPSLAPEIPLHACALAIEALLVHEDGKRIRKCGASDCSVYYIDASKAQLRQWCSMKGCGNREKQRRWRSAAR
ncbi:MAG: CGNR zinc finger domain-containing protein [Hyphomicrobiaceae bacterium]